jgi:hypothetical protein
VASAPITSVEESSETCRRYIEARQPVTIPLMAGPDEPRNGPSSAIGDHRASRLRSRADIAHQTGERPHLHVPGELLVAREDLPLISRDLAELEARELEVPRNLQERLARFVLPSGEPLPSLVSRLRSRGVGRAVRVGPHHVVTGMPYIQGGPAGFPTATGDRFEVSPCEPTGVRVALLDTGYTPRLHPWLDARVEADGSLQKTDLQQRDGWLEDEVGHATFVAGLIVERAPGVRIRITEVLDSEGYGSELALADAIIEYAAEADIVNLSLGCYSHDDLPPIALAEALRRLGPASVVVAAAGNNDSDRPFWPAAHKRVIAVAALDAGLQRAPFSNYGWWVDAAAPGVEVLGAFVDFDEQDDANPIPGRSPQNFRGWARWDGTSFAVPRLVGAIAAALANGAAASASEAAAEVFARASRRGDPELGFVLDV